MKKKLKANKGDSPTRIMIQCAAPVGKKSVRRESINGVEHVIITSFTLPDDIVMNGIFYPAEEIDKSYQTLERTFAPIEHPVDSSGNFMSASDPEAVHNFHGGAFNMNVEKVDGRIKLDKYVNVQEALKTDRGRRLLDRIEEIETKSNARPVHTSVAAYLNVEELSAPAVNSMGQEYSEIARDLFFDHDSILLDSVGAAQPSQGVGMAVNSAGEEFAVQTYELEANAEDDFDYKTKVNAQSFSDRHEAVYDALNKSGIPFSYIEEMYEGEVVFSSEQDLFTVPYTIDETTERASIVGIPLPVKRNVTYIPKVNKKGDAMKEAIVNALKKAGIEVEGLDDGALLSAYNSLQANQNDSDDNSDKGDEANLAEVVANAIAPLAEDLKGLKTQLNAKSEEEVERFAGIVGNSDKYPGIDAEKAKLLGLETLKDMAANCAESYGLGGDSFSTNNSAESAVASEMPE